MLRDTATDSDRPLPARLLVGRASTASLVIEDKRVSGEHATLAWNGTEWVIRDLSSRNGTFVDGQRLSPGATHTLAEGARLSFGDDDGRFCLVDAGPPGPMARDRSSNLLITGTGGLLALPDDEHPEVVVFTDARGEWVMEHGDERRDAAHGDTVEAAGRTYEILLPDHVEGTATVDVGPTIDTISLKFGVSMDEEHVRLTLVHRGSEQELERREHGYVLLTLARQRLEDAALPLAEQGWVDRNRLLKWLQLDANGLNVAIYRARGQLAGAGVDGAAGIVEVRRGQRRIGLEPARIAVGPM